MPAPANVGEFIDVVRNRRAALMALIKEQVDREAVALGIKVVDVKIRHADLPQQNSTAIYQRMNTERQRQATEIRATGEQARRPHGPCQPRQRDRRTTLRVTHNRMGRATR